MSPGIHQITGGEADSLLRVRQHGLSSGASLLHAEPSPAYYRWFSVSCGGRLGAASAFDSGASSSDTCANRLCPKARSSDLGQTACFINGIPGYP